MLYITLQNSISYATAPLLYLGGYLLRYYRFTSLINCNHAV